MDKNYIFLVLLCFFSLLGYAQQLVITNVVDGSCGNTSKFVELYVSGTVDLSNYKLVRRSNSGTWADDGVDIDLSSFGNRTDEFIYLIRDLATLNTEFPNENISSSNSEVNDDISHNGDDSYRLVEISGDVVIDQFGGDTDGTGETWEYSDSWGSRNNDVGPNPVFTESEWTFHGVDVLDTEGDCNGADPLENTVTTIGEYSNVNLATQTFHKNLKISLYPNPVTSGFLSIETPSNTLTEIEIFNVLGKRVLTENNPAEKIDVSMLKSGVYIVSVGIGEENIYKRIIIK